MCEESTKTFGGQQIFCRHWKAATNDPKCLVFICHGFGEHCGRYDEVSALLNKENIYVFSHDHVGHGRSSGPRACVNNYDNDYCSPVKMHIEETAAKFHGKKVFIYAHSMGGLIAARLMQMAPSLAAGIVMEAPFLAMPDSVPKWQVNLGYSLGGVIGSLPLSKVDCKLLSHDPTIKPDYEKDKLVYHGMANAKFLRATVDVQTQFFKEAQSLTTPILICHGEADGICPISGSKQLYEKAGSADSTFKVFPNAYHQLHAETDDVKKPFFKTVADWICAHC